MARGIISNLMFGRIQKSPTFILLMCRIRSVCDTFFIA